MLDKPPVWLPEIVSVNGEWKHVLKILYDIFEQDFIRNRVEFQNLPVWWDRRRVGSDPYEEGFWHLITKDDEYSGNRLFDPRRAERLPWCRPTLMHWGDAEIKIWDYRESNGKIRTYVWLENWDYVIILQKRQQDLGEIAFLLTAYHVDYDSTKRNLQAKYSKRQRA